MCLQKMSDTMLGSRALNSAGFYEYCRGYSWPSLQEIHLFLPIMASTIFSITYQIPVLIPVPQHNLCSCWKFVPICVLTWFGELGRIFPKQCIWWLSSILSHSAFVIVYVYDCLRKIFGLTNCEYSHCLYLWDSNKRD
jgi:hypothetical protein